MRTYKKNKKNNKYAKQTKKNNSIYNEEIHINKKLFKEHILKLR